MANPRQNTQQEMSAEIQSIASGYHDTVAADGAVTALRELAKGLQVFPSTMRRNLAISGPLLLSEAAGAPVPAVALPDAELDRQLDPAGYLGESSRIVERIFATYPQRVPEGAGHE